METIEELQLKKPGRQARLNAWIAQHGLRKCDLARALGVSPAMISEIISGRSAPRGRIEQLVALGVPEDLLPEPNDVRPGRKGAAEAAVA